MVTQSTLWWQYRSAFDWRVLATMFVLSVVGLLVASRRRTSNPSPALAVPAAPQALVDRRVESNVAEVFQDRTDLDGRYPLEAQIEKSTPPASDRLSDADVERIAQRVAELLVAAREGRDRRL